MHNTTLHPIILCSSKLSNVAASDHVHLLAKIKASKISRERAKILFHLGGARRYSPLLRQNAYVIHWTKSGNTSQDNMFLNSRSQHRIWITWQDADLLEDTICGGPLSVRERPNRPREQHKWHREVHPVSWRQSHQLLPGYPLFLLLVQLHPT